MNVAGRSPVCIPAQFIRAFPPEMLDLPPDAMLRAFVGRLLGFVEDERFVSLLRVVLGETIYDPTLSPFGIAAVQQATGFLQNYLAEKMDDGQLRRSDTVLAAQVLMGSVMAFVLRRQLLHDPTALGYDREEMVEGIVSTTLQGLLPR